MVCVKIRYVQCIYFEQFCHLLFSLGNPALQREGKPSKCSVWLSSTWQLQSKQPTCPLLPASWGSWLYSHYNEHSHYYGYYQYCWYCQWSHGDELSAPDGSNELCHFAAVNPVWLLCEPAWAFLCNVECAFVTYEREHKYAVCSNNFSRLYKVSQSDIFAYIYTC